MGCSDDDEKTPGANCKELKACCDSLSGVGKTACDKAYGLTNDNETICKTSLGQLQGQGYCNATTDGGADSAIVDSATDDTSTGDTSTGDTSTGDTSTGDTSTSDTSTGDTSTSDTSTGDTSTSDI